MTYQIDPARYDPSKIVLNLFAGEDQLGKAIRFNYSWRDHAIGFSMDNSNWENACLVEGDVIGLETSGSSRRFQPVSKTTSEPEQNGQKCNLYEPNGESMFYTLRDLDWLKYPLFFDTTEPPEGLTAEDRSDLYCSLAFLGSKLEAYNLCPSFAVSAHLEAKNLARLSLTGLIAGCEFFAPLDEAQIAKATYMAENMDMGKSLFIVNIDPSPGIRSQLGPIANLVALHQHKLCVRVPGEQDKQIPLALVRKALGVDE